MATGKENIRNPPVMEEDDDDDDEAFLPPGFLMPQKPASDSVPLLANFLGDGLEPDFLGAGGSNGTIDDDDDDDDDDDAFNGGDSSPLDGSQLRDVGTQYEEEEAATSISSKKEDDDGAEDAELDLKLDALAAALQAEVHAGNKMMQEMDGSDPAPLDDDSVTAKNEDGVKDAVSASETSASSSSSPTQQATFVDASVQTTQRRVFPSRRSMHLPLQRSRNS